MKKRLLLIFIAMLTVISGMSGQRVPQELYDRMKAASKIYSTSESKEERLKAFKEMDETDELMKLHHAYESIENLDTLTASRSEYRNTGIALENSSSEHKDEAFELYKIGASMGDPFCLNRILVMIMKTNEADIRDALSIMKYYDNQYYPPLIFNMAMVFYHSGNEDLKKGGIELAKTYSNLVKFNNSGYEFEMGPYPLGEYLDCAETRYGIVWADMSDYKYIDKKIERILNGK